MAPDTSTGTGTGTYGVAPGYGDSHSDSHSAPVADLPDDECPPAWMNPLSGNAQGPDAAGMWPWVLLCSGAVWDILHAEDWSTWVTVSAVVSVLAAAGLYVATIRLAFAQRRRAAGITLSLLSTTVFGSTSTFGHGWFYMIPMLAIAIGVSIRGREMPLILGAHVVIGSVLMWSANGHFSSDVVTLAWGTFTAGLIPAIIIRLWDAIRALQRTREELARSAVAEERLRFSRDLHDLLGHTLSVMVVKAEAVRRLAPRDAGAAARQAADIERIGREALTEVRAAVTGYRGRGLTEELETARTALADAQIALTVRTPVLRLPPETDALLGWAVREGVTNVIRHSTATTCEIDLRADDAAPAATAPASIAPVSTGPATTGGTGVALVVRDNGRGGPAAPGHGLAGLRERVAALGGTMTAGEAAEGGFALQITVP